MTSKSARDRRTSLRRPLLGLAIGALVYVGVLGLVIKLAIQPNTARLSLSSRAVLEEYRESTLRAGSLDATITDLWRHLGAARLGRVPLDTLAPLREGVERLAETSNAINRLSSEEGSQLRDILASAVIHEERLRVVVLGAISFIEIGDVASAEHMLRLADSLDTPLSDALNRATTTALQQMNDQESRLQRSVGAMNAIVWIWLIGGLLALPLMTVLLRKRLLKPLAHLNMGLDRIGDGDLDVTLQAERPDELGRLVEHFNRMTAVLRQRAAEENQRAEDRTAARMKLILDAALDAVVVADAAGNIKEWSPQAEYIFGWTRAEVLEKRVVDTIIPPEYRDAHNEGMRRFAATGKSSLSNRRQELVALRRDGTRFPIEITITPIKRGIQTEFSAFIRDITEAKRAQTAIAESESRYRAAFEQVAVGMVEVDLDGTYLRVNPAFAELVGRPVEDVVGRHFTEVTLTDDRDGDENVFARLVAGENLTRRQKRYLRPDGTVAAASLTAAVVRDAEGKPRYVLTVVQGRDCTKETRGGAAASSQDGRRRPARRWFRA